MTDCTNNCHANLDPNCYTQICKPIYADVEHSCVYPASPVMVRFTASTHVSKLSWSPSGTISYQCKQEIKRYDKEVMDHETKHVKDLKDIVDSANERLKNGIVDQAESCEDTEQKARESLKKKISERLKQESSAIEQEYNKKVQEFHNSPSSRITLPKCEKCRNH